MLPEGYCTFAAVFPIPSFLKYWLLATILLVGALRSYADTLTLHPSPAGLGRQTLTPYFYGWKDASGTATPGDVLQSKQFVPLSNLLLAAPTQVYWLKLPLQLANTFDEPILLGFSHLTYVDAFLYQGGRLLWRRHAGAFRPRSCIQQGDGRFHLNFPQLPVGQYTLLLRVHHTKGYQPHNDFALHGLNSYHETISRQERADAWAQGAVGIFLLYTLLSWWGSRYRPYLWLGLFIAGVGMYSLCSGRYFIDWLFPENPEVGWLFNGPFLHLGLLGFYLLVIEFWKLPEYNPAIYRFGKVCIVVLALVSVSGLCINYFTGNFNLANTINLWAFLFPFSFTCALLVRCYPRLNRAQKYLYYGILLFLVTSLLLTLSSAFIKEQALVFAPYISNFTSLAVFLLFSTGLKEALRQHEIDKGTVLERLNQMQQQQNTLLEQRVAARTEALQQSNALLIQQTELLGQRNHTIETLINELSHRVKNNLQLLYGLFSLQLPNVTDQNANHILKSNMARIRAMMIVNQKLDYENESNQVNLATLVKELVSHLQDIYDRPKKVKIVLDIQPALELHSGQALSIGLILTELLTNSFKYAFLRHNEPCISISCSAGNQLELVYADNGAGIAYPLTGPSASMGLSLVKDLTRQLNGTLATFREEGLNYKFNIPVAVPASGKNE